jgi:hypothetical protein
LLKTDISARLFLIGRRDRVEALAAGSHASGPTTALRDLLAGDSVLVYEDDDRRSAMRRFTRSLTAALDGIAR